MNDAAWFCPSGRSVKTRIRFCSVAFITARPSTLVLFNEATFFDYGPRTHGGPSGRQALGDINSFAIIEIVTISSINSILILSVGAASGAFAHIDLIKGPR